MVPAPGLLQLRQDHSDSEPPHRARPTAADAEAAVRTLIAWAGDDPTREGLLDTPRRVARAYAEFFAGYGTDPSEHLSRTFEEVEGYDGMVLVRDIDFDSHCEHHMVPFTGTADIAYLPNDRVVGLSKLARVVEGYARRLQIQEKLTAQIASALEQSLSPLGVAVRLRAQHECMTCRGVRKRGSLTVTQQWTGAFREDESARREFLSACS